MPAKAKHDESGADQKSLLRKYLLTRRRYRRAIERLRVAEIVLVRADRERMAASNRTQLERDLLGNLYGMLSDESKKLIP